MTWKDLLKNMLNSVALISTFFVVALSCNRYAPLDPDKARAPKEHYEDYIVRCHNIGALHLLTFYYGGKDNLPYAMYLAEADDSGEACFEVLQIIADQFEAERRTSPVYDSLIVYYAKKGTTLGNADCTRCLADLYKSGNLLPKSEIFYSYYKAKADSLVALRE